jgi:hypothetical protein
VAEVTNLIAGTKKRFTNGSQTVTIENTPYTIDQIVALLTTILTNRSAVEAAQATASAKVDAERAALPSLLAIVVAYVTFIRLTFGTSAEALADFGLEPPRAPVPLTAEQKAVAVAKRKATRAARGTTSAKAKKKSAKGNVTATLVVTAGSSPEAAAPAAPAAPAAGGTAPKVG